MRESIALENLTHDTRPGVIQATVKADRTGGGRVWSEGTFEGFIPKAWVNIIHPGDDALTARDGQ